ncbi:MAG TPA: ParA family protein [Bacilli bacterium]|nr:ParA family protein [Bacilli bacterium]
MGIIIAIANQKGGVGKTTTAINLGAALAREQKRTLLIDLDEQANATIGIGFSRENVAISSFELLTRDIDIREAICNTKDSYFDIVPSSNKLASIEKTLYGCEDKEQNLMKKVEPIKNSYDYILLDCPPSLGVIIDNALFVSDSVIIPVECKFFAYDALTQMVNKINQVQKAKNKINKSLTIEGVLLTKLDNRNVFGYKIMDKVKSLFPTKTFNTIINRSSHLQEAPMHGKTVIDFAYNSRGSKEYRELAKEIINNNEAN